MELETSLRQMALAKSEPSFSLNDYVQFEEALVTATLGDNDVKPIQDPHLRAAYQIILAIRRIAQNYMASAHGFLNEYFPALFLYCLLMMKYHQSDTPQPTRLVFITASVLIPHLLEK